MKNPEQYKEIKELRCGNAIICVYIPDLTEEEKNRHEKQLPRALQQFGKAMQKVEKGECA